MKRVKNTPFLEYSMAVQNMKEYFQNFQIGWLLNNN